MQTTQQSTDAAIAEAHSEKVRAIYAAAAPWRETAERGELLSFDSVQQIKDMNAATGGHFFDADSMRYFGSKVYGPVIGGRYFITSEQDRNPYGAAAWNGQRRYTVRECRN